MAQATRAAFDTQPGIDSRPALRRMGASVAGQRDVRLTIHNDLASIEKEWRAFERDADCTVFQTFDWMSAWHRNVGARNGVTPVIITMRDSGGSLLLILPFAIEAGMVRRLTWFASGLCDYNAPLLAADFSRR